jgi:hypothetical protein
VKETLHPASHKVHVNAHFVESEVPKMVIASKGIILAAAPEE